MARFVIVDAVISINSVDLSDHSDQVVVTMSADAVDATVFGMAGGSSRLHGIHNDSFEVQFHQDFAASEVDATLSPLVANKTTFPVQVRAFPGAISSTNPRYTGDCKLFDYTPISGNIGDISKTSSTFFVEGKITRMTTTT